MIDRSVLRAVSRISPKMFAYHLKRAFRNRVVGKAPNLYARYVNFKANSLPQVRLTGQENIKLAQTIADFYAPEYRPHADEAAEGTITLFDTRLAFGAPDKIDWHAIIDAENDFHLWRMKLAHMGFVCPMLIDGVAKQMDAVEDIIDGFSSFARYDQPGCFTSYWFPYSVSHRVLAIMSGLIIANAEGKVSPRLKAKVEEFLHWNASFILANIEHELKNNHVERNLAALCLYLDCAESVPAKLSRRIDRDVREIIGACVLEDGMLAERSAMYQGLTVKALNVFAETRFLSVQTRKLAQSMLPRALRAWALMSHPDGEIALFNDSWFGEVPQIGHISDQQELGAAEALPQAGYTRLHQGQFFVLFDAGPIGPSWNPGHGHGDFLSAEIDVSNVRFIVDPGTFQYSTGERRHYERSAQSHNGPCWNDIVPVDYTGCFKVGKMAEALVVETKVEDTMSMTRGELVLPEGTARRSLLVSNQGVRVTDNWSNGTANTQVTLCIQGEWTLVSWDAQCAIFSNDGLTARLDVAEGCISEVTSGQWSRYYLKSETATLLLLKPAADTDNKAQLSWQVSV